ncbi:alpha/beta hydrolase [Vibrio sp.]|nr:alpha/beta hydrolase [Vibrio sp.]
MMNHLSFDALDLEHYRRRIQRADHIEEFNDIEIHGENGARVSFDLFCPSRSNPARQQREQQEVSSAPPLMIFLHSGSWKAGTKSQFHSHCLHFTNTFGFKTLTTSYRLSTEAVYPAPIHDIQFLLHWIKENHVALHIDPERIILVGTSAGANIAASVITEQHTYDQGLQPKLSILFNGEFDMWDLIEQGSLVDAMNAYVGSTPDVRPDRFDAISPLKHVKPNMPSTLLLHGTNDQFVSHQQSIDFKNTMLTHGNHAEVHICEDKQHNWFLKEPDFSSINHIIDVFIREQLD